jgi:peptide-methionine (S)-S-oxide reductase
MGRLQASGRYRRPIVTEVTAAPEWWPAEDYHQRYFEKHGRTGCAI